MAPFSAFGEFCLGASAHSRDNLLCDKRLELRVRQGSQFSRAKVRRITRSVTWPEPQIQWSGASGAKVADFRVVDVANEQLLGGLSNRDVKERVHDGRVERNTTRGRFQQLFLAAKRFVLPPITRQ